MPERRTEVSATTDGEFVYVLGGFGKGRSAPRAVYVYDPNTDSWTITARLLEGVNHAGLVYLDGRLFVVGGYRENSFTAVDTLRIYDLTKKTWSEGALMPTPRGALAVTVLFGRIHAIGGTGPKRISVNAHEVYEPDTDSWSTRAPLPTARNHHGATVVRDRYPT